VIHAALGSQRENEDVSEALERLQAYWHTSARESLDDAIEIPPFTLYRGAATYPSYVIAIPTSGPTDDLATSLGELRRRVAEVAEVAHIEVIENLHPALPAMLREDGFSEGVREPLMICTREALRTPQTLPGFSVVTLTDASSIEEIREGLDVNERGFDPSFSGSIDAEDAARFRNTLAEARAFTARLDGVPVAGGMYMAPRGGLTRLTGVATLEPFRRRGIGAALTAHITQTTFAAGVECAFLAAATEEAARVYERIGYTRVGVVLGYDAPV
jgi:GNAT superfamily N-acetyltransferase